MDIKSLLSPSEPKVAPHRASAAAAVAAAASSRAAGQRQPTKSPHESSSRSGYDYDSTSSHPAQHHLQSAQSADAHVHIPESRYANVTEQIHQHRPLFAHRTSSQRSVQSHVSASAGKKSDATTPSAADFFRLDGASHQHTSHPGMTNHSSGRSLLSTLTQSPRSPGTQPASIALSNRTLVTVTMDAAPVQTPTPRNFTSEALSTEELNTVTALLSHLNENSYSHASHVQLINLLHKGFVSASQNGVSSSYSLLAELRQAREAMDSRFAVGEAMWQDWLRDEIPLVASSEDRVAITELMQRAVHDEPVSTSLWQIYVDWLESNYAACHGLSTAEGWSEEDKELCKDLFTRDTLEDVLEQAANATAWRIDTGYALANRYLSSLRLATNTHAAQDGSNARSRTLPELERLFVSRLKTPHNNIDSTLELFMPIAAQLYSERDWQPAMTQIERIMDASRKQLKMRDAHESKIQYSIDTDDQKGLFNAFEQYLKWDRTRKNRSDNEKEMRCSLYERALLHFPTTRNWWVAYIDYVISQQPSTHNPSQSVLPLLERATRHCPWAGELWARRILRSDYERLSRDEIEACKHRATNSGLLDVGGMEDLMKVLVEWCSYLRRHAFAATATDDDKDTAEVGMTMALEDIQQAGKKLLGPDFQGDPYYRIESIQIKFLSQARRMSDARRVWRSLVALKKDSYEFWHHYYTWEITLWVHDRVNDAERVETTETGPVLATAIMEEAIAQHNLDWPEKVHEMYVNHFQWHESVEKLQDATIVAWAFQQKIAAKRAKDAEIALAQGSAAAAEYVAPIQEQGTTREKRKLSTDDIDRAEDAKKVKVENNAAPADEAKVTQKRDREHLSVNMTNLDAETTELDLRKFFRDCGEILSVSLLVDEAQNMASAVVEFSDEADVEAAKTRSGKDLRGRSIQVRSGSMSTLYVANYPPEYDEAAIRALFAAYGEIISVRFPSLRYNAKRRFCYVQFLTNEMARAAECALDEKMLDGTHRLLAKISDPDAKKTRSGAQAEGRELFVRNLDNEVSEAEFKAFFAKHGTVMSVKLLKNLAGKRLGSGFVVYNTAEEATKAIQETDHKPLGDRVLHVALAQAKGIGTEQAKKKDIIIKHDSDAQSARRGSDASMASGPSTAPDGGDSYKTVRERQIAIFNLPDTVTDARITAEMEKHGPLVKIQLRRNQDGAIVEFKDVQVAFQVREGVDCSALGPNTKTGDVKDLFASSDSTKKAAAKSVTSRAMMPTSLGRPQQSGGRRGRLGFKRGGLGSGSTAHKTAHVATTNGNAVKSNAEFRSMFEKSKATEAKTGADTESK